MTSLSVNKWYIIIILLLTTCRGGWRSLLYSITLRINKNCPKVLGEGRAAAKKEFNNDWFGSSCNRLFYQGAKWQYTQQWGREGHRHVLLPMKFVKYAYVYVYTNVSAYAMHRAYAYAYTRVNAKVLSNPSGH